MMSRHQPESTKYCCLIWGYVAPAISKTDHVIFKKYYQIDRPRLISDVRQVASLQVKSIGILTG